MSQHRRARAAWLAVLAPCAAAAAEQAAPLADTMPSVIVTGQRASLESARQIRRTGVGVVDAVVADDIDKLPDASVNDALQRIPGVQIGRDRGEGTAAAIRGLTQMETTLNGREVFTAGAGRTLAFADVPAEMVAAVSVYKTATAGQLEGGVGGLVDLRTRRPFDFDGTRLAATARYVYGELVEGGAPQYSALASSRWQTGAGEFGALVSLFSQRRAWREDQKSSANPALRKDLVPGQDVLVPAGGTETASLGRRERDAFSTVLQWRPFAGAELYAEGNYAQFKTVQDSYQVNLSAPATFVPGSVALFPGTRDVQRITWVNAPMSVLSFARDTVDRNRQLAVGGNWRTGDWLLQVDASRTDSINSLFFSGGTLAATAPQYSIDYSGKVPATAVSGLGDAAAYRYAGAPYRTLPFEGALNALRFDATLARPGRLFHTVAAGVRLARRSAGNGSGLIFADATVSLPSSAAPLTAGPVGSLFPGEPGGSIGGLLYADLAQARDALAWRRLLGVTAAIPAQASPLSLWHIDEHSTAAWLMADFKADGVPLDGNAGVRATRQREALSGSRSMPGGAAGQTVIPLTADDTALDWLPSASLRYRPSSDTIWRAAVSRTMTRPNFDKLSPSLTLVRNTITPTANTGNAGNPALRPVRSDNLDLAFERYGAGNSMLSATVFFKHVDGFITSASAPEVYDGVTYQVTRPQNGNQARIKGLELGYQQFFDFLPGAWRGLGTQINATWVDSSTASPVLGASVPLQNLSRRSANAVLMYERGPWSARAAVNWRSSFVSDISNIVGVGALPLTTQGYAWVDAALRYEVSQRLTLALEGNNLTNTVRRNYYGAPQRQQSSFMNDRQVAVSAAFRY